MQPLRYFTIFICGLGGIGIILSAWLVRQDVEWFDNKNNGELEQNYRAGLSYYVKKPLAEKIHQLTLEPGASSKHLAMVDHYLTLNPLDQQTWLAGSEFAARLGDLVTAKQYLSGAHALSLNSHFMLTKVFNAYMQLGMTLEATRVGHDLAIANPNSLEDSLFLLSSVRSDYDSLVSQFIPANASDGRHQDVDYHAKALSFALKIKNRLLARSVWRNTPTANKHNSQVGYKYLSMIASNDDFDRAKEVWEELDGTQMNHSDIVNGDFSAAINESSLCWNINNAGRGWSWARASEEASEDAYLTISFDGSENVNFADVSCYIAVEESTSYNLTGKWKGDRITTLSGLYVDVYSPATKSVLSSLDARVGTWAWQPLAVEFSVPKGVNSVLFRVRRKRTNFLDNKLSGMVAFDNFVVAPVDAAAGGN